MILADVNVLVYAHREDLPQHERFSAWLGGEIESGRSFALCDASLTGFLRIVTNGRIFASPTPSTWLCGPSKSFESNLPRLTWAPALDTGGSSATSAPRWVLAATMSPMLTSPHWPLSPGAS